jgi:hypothetical protein
MCTNLKTGVYICSVESATVNLQSQLRNYKPFRGVLALHKPGGFFVFNRFISAKGPGRGQTWMETSLDQTNSVLGNRKPRRTFCFSRRGVFFSFPLILLGLVAFPFFSFKILLLILWL